MDDQAVGERHDVQLLEQCRLRVAHLLAFLNQVHVGHDLDLALHDLSGDLQHLEEAGLAGVAASGAGGHHDVDGGDGTHTRGRGHAVSLDGLADLRHVTGGKHEADVALDVRQQLLEWVARVLLQVSGHDLADHGVLAHQDLTLATKGDADLLHLAGTDVIHTNNEQLAVSVQQVLQLLKIFGFTGRGQRHGKLGERS